MKKLVIHLTQPGASSRAHTDLLVNNRQSFDGIDKVLHAITLIRMLEFRKSCFCLFSSLLILILTINHANAVPAFHPPADIQATAEQYVLHNLGESDRLNSEVRAKLDPRLKLAQCQQRLTAFYPEYGRRTGNVTVGIRCEAEQQWSIFVPVRVSIFRNIAVATNSLSRGTIIDESHVHFERRNISTFASDYFTKLEDLIGKQLKHSLQKGGTLASHNLKYPTAIKRGNHVTLLAKNDVIEVRMEGKALSDGAIGERIKVQNLRSNRVVEGVIKTSKIIHVQ